MAGINRRPWFAVKRIGYGLVLPISWEGWTILSLLAAAITLAVMLLPTIAAAICMMLLTAAFLYIVAARCASDGGRRDRE